MCSDTLKSFIPEIGMDILDSRTGQYFIILRTFFLATRGFNQVNKWHIIQWQNGRWILQGTIPSSKIECRQIDKSAVASKCMHFRSAI